MADFKFFILDNCFGEKIYTQAVEFFSFGDRQDVDNFYSFRNIHNTWKYLVEVRADLLNKFWKKKMKITPPTAQMHTKKENKNKIKSHESHFLEDKNIWGWGIRIEDLLQKVENNKEREGRGSSFKLQDVDVEIAEEWPTHVG